VRNFVLGILFAIVLLLVGVYFCFEKGYVNFAADQRPSLMEAKLAMAAVDASTDRRAPEGPNPMQPTEENIAAGAKIYLDRCAGCHGIPSNPDSLFSRSFDPPAPGFFTDAPDMPENQNFYIIRHGIRWTGMPAWKQTLNETQTWQVVTFLSNVEKLPPAAKKILGPSTASPSPMPMQMPMSMPMDH
jgi:thiosulfate dehydrogenase